MRDRGGAGGPADETDLDPARQAGGDGAAVSALEMPGATLKGAGPTLVVLEWGGPGPGVLHVHHADDEAWHVLSGRLRFRLGDAETAEAGPGETIFVPAGMPHDYDELEPSRYLLILTPRLRALIAALGRAEPGAWDGVMRDHASELLEHA